MVMSVEDAKMNISGTIKDELPKHMTQNAYLISRPLSTRAKLSQLLRSGDIQMWTISEEETV